MGKENKTVYVILGLLSHEDLSGYDIKKRIDQSLGMFWNTGFGQIYPTLKQLMEKELIIRKEHEDDFNREKIIYSITEKGKCELKEWLCIRPEMEVVKYEILLKLFFGSLVDEKNHLENIQKFRENYEGKLPIMEQFESQLRNILEQSPDHKYYLLTVLFGKKIYQAYLDWADEAMKLLEQKQ